MIIPGFLSADGGYNSYRIISICGDYGSSSIMNIYGGYGSSSIMSIYYWRLWFFRLMGAYKYN